MERIVGEKYSSLFCRSISDEAKGFNVIGLAVKGAAEVAAEVEVPIQSLTKILDNFHVR
jgi:hypothetical protein